MPSTSSHLTFLWKEAWGEIFKVFLCIKTQTGTKALQKLRHSLFRHLNASRIHPAAHQQRATRCLPVLPRAERVEQPTRCKGAPGQRAWISSSAQSTALDGRDDRGVLQKGSRKAPGHGGRERGLACAADVLPRVCQVCCWRGARALGEEFPWQTDWEH